MIAFTAGSFECRQISDGELELPAEVMVVGHTGDPIAVPIGCPLIRNEDLVAPDDVGLVLITHAHIDHIGGLCSAGRPQFPAARHVISRVDRELRTDHVAAEQNVATRRALLGEAADTGRVVAAS